MSKTQVITIKEDLAKKVQAYLLNLRSNLMDSGYSEEDAEKAIAGNLPYCIFRHAQL